MKVKEVGVEVEDVGGLKLEHGKEGGRQGRGKEGRRSSRSHFGVVDPFVFLLNCLFVVLGFVVLLLLVREGVRSRSICCALRSSKSAETRRVGGLSHA